MVRLQPSDNELTVKILSKTSQFHYGSITTLQKDYHITWKRLSLNSTMVRLQQAITM